MTYPPKHTYAPTIKLTTMEYEKKLTRKEVLEEVAKFQKNMEELRLIRDVINDIRYYRHMIRLRRFD